MFAAMKKFLPAILIAAIFAGCNSSDGEKALENMADTRDSFAILSQFWYVFDSENPKDGDIYTKVDDVDIHPGIVFMYDSTVLENPKGFRAYGKYTMNNDVIDVTYDSARRVQYLVTRLTAEELQLERINGKDTTTLQYKPSNTYWPKGTENPFSKENYAWAVKPSQPETDEQIKQRVKDCVKFFQYFYEGHVRGGAKSINFDALPDPFKWYPGAIFVRKEDELGKKFVNCFYSKEEALKGRQMLEDALTKKYNWNESEKNWLKQTASVLDQIAEQL